MRNKFVYSCSISLCLGIQWTLGKQFLPPASYGSIFPAKSYWDAWRSGSRLVRGHVNMVDKAKLHSPVHSTFEALVVLYEVGYCHGELNPFYWPIPIAGIVVFGASHPFAGHIFQMCNGFTRIQKAVVDQTGSRPPNSNHDFSLMQVWLWEVLWSFFSVQPLSWSLRAVVHNPLFITRHNPIEK